MQETRPPMACPARGSSQGRITRGPSSSATWPAATWSVTISSAKKKERVISSGSSSSSWMACSNVRPVAISRARPARQKPALLYDQTWPRGVSWGTSAMCAT